MAKLSEFLDKTNLERSLLIGFYGGGNYGDELLLEVLLNLFKLRNIQDLTIAHQQPDDYDRYHADFDYKLVNMRSIGDLGKAIFKNKQIIVGGGGLWGRDVNLNIFLFSLMLWISRHILGKHVYLLGVGYYNSTSKLGRISAWFAGKAANYIIARDDETVTNFSRLTHHVVLDDDIALSLTELDLDRYQDDAEQLEANFKLQPHTVFVTIRRLKADFTDRVETLIRNNPDKNFIVMILEPRQVDPDGFIRIRQMAEKYDNVTARDFSFNPVLLYVFFVRNAQELCLVGPQFHIIITAYLAEVPYLPVVYDNKVQELLRKFNVANPLDIYKLTDADLQTFVDAHYIRAKGA
jgi:polysaccharide pyruvyl transferase WcaK-like protein